jgi:hypothetical protein
MHRLVVLPAALVVLLGGCAVNTDVTVHSAPVPTAQQAQQIRSVQSRVIAVPYDAVFPKVLDVLMDGGFLVRSVNERMGFVYIYQQWTDAEQLEADLIEEGSILFQPAGQGTTLVRVVLTGGWQRLQVTGGGPRSTDTGMVGGVQAGAPPEEYRKLLDLLESGLAGARK